MLGEQYSLLVDAKELDRSSPVSVSATLAGLSPTVRHDFPRADPYTKEWSVPVYAKAAAEAAIGEAIQWDIVNWEIPAYRLVVEAVAPIEVVNMLAEAAGGVVEAALDGTLIVRPLFPVTVPDYATTTPDHTLVETSDMLSLTERFVSGRIYNKFCIKDSEADYADIIEFTPDPDDPYKGVLRAFPSPWREYVNVVDTSGAVVNVYGTGVPISEEWIGARDPDPEDIPKGELLEIFEGAGNVQYPIWGITGLVWESEPLGGVTYIPETNTVRMVDDTDLYGLLYIKYTIKYFLYYVELDRSIDLSETKNVQFLMEDTTEDIL